MWYILMVSAHSRTMAWWFDSWRPEQISPSGCFSSLGVTGRMDVLAKQGESSSAFQSLPQGDALPAWWETARQWTCALSSPYIVRGNVAPSFPHLVTSGSNVGQGAACVMSSVRDCVCLQRPILDTKTEALGENYRRLKLLRKTLIIMTDGGNAHVLKTEPQALNLACVCIFLSSEKCAAVPLCLPLVGCQMVPRLKIDVHSFMWHNPQ